MNRALEKEIAAFVESLEFHLVHLIEKAAPYLQGLSRAETDLAMEISLLVLWANRSHFDPAKDTLASFFSRIVRYVTDLSDRRRPEYTEEEQAVLDAIQGKTQVAEVKHLSMPHTRVKVDPVRKPGKDCPPCFRCKYFYGWLPAQPLQKEKHSDSEIEAACWALDQRKVAIANWVRSGKTWTEAELQQE